MVAVAGVDGRERRVTVPYEDVISTKVDFSPGTLHIMNQAATATTSISADPHLAFLSLVDGEIQKVTDLGQKAIDEANDSIESSLDTLLSLEDDPIRLPYHEVDLIPSQIIKVISSVTKRMDRLQHLQGILQKRLNPLRVVQSALEKLVKAKQDKISQDDPKFASSKATATERQGRARLLTFEEDRFLSEVGVTIRNTEDTIRFINSVREAQQRITQDAKYSHKIIEGIHALQSWGTHPPSKDTARIDLPDMSKVAVPSKSEVVDDPTLIYNSSLPEITDPKEPETKVLSVEEFRGQLAEAEEAHIEPAATDDIDAAFSDFDDSYAQEAETPSSGETTPPADTSGEDAGEDAASPAPETVVQQQQPSDGDRKLKWLAYRDLGLPGQLLELGIDPSSVVAALKLADKNTLSIRKLVLALGFDKADDESKYDGCKRFIKEFCLDLGIIEKEGKMSYTLGPNAEKWDELFEEALGRVAQAQVEVAKVPLSSGEAIADLMSMYEDSPSPHRKARPGDVEFESSGLLESKADANIDPAALLEDEVLSPPPQTKKEANSPDREQTTLAEGSTRSQETPPAPVPPQPPQREPEISIDDVMDSVLEGF